MQTREGKPWLCVCGHSVLYHGKTQDIGCWRMITQLDGRQRKCICDSTNTPGHPTDSDLEMEQHTSKTLRLQNIHRLLEIEGRTSNDVRNLADDLKNIIARRTAVMD